MSNYETILTSVDGRVATITLNRPKALNALNTTVMKELVEAVEGYEADRGIGAIVIIGSEKAFAAGADIKEMVDLRYPAIFVDDIFSGWDRLQKVRTPIITAVSGYALGGGCELAMMGDILLAADNAKFGQPEITLGVIPGMGGSQRLTQAIGKAKSMDMILTGRQIGAEEAERSGLVSRVLPLEGFAEAVADIAAHVADMPLSAAYAATEAVDRSFEVSLAEGVHYERRVFHSLFSSPNKVEGMKAFIEKRRPKWDRG
ncbi:enoyl-CoA hydratase/isomerase family protein [Corynebacterium sp. TAE3-ERU12]|uniref:enoyl-CoA hydratase-related protein n=1 Tax=Corynebacterium sp. TAE3-ERU12 TaxID=2849491 RepID=UPI001C483786|nr:enoyl-CoA hydratase-related protein [Corynebacterium sp. TAE3-ERU12]MBV7295839.1 enoyl-CoA hydratase/isomerase family protein [Corynebacterium sp. TAE3-ERU12]